MRQTLFIGCIFSFLLLFFVSTQTAHAQFSQALPTQISVEMLPQNPGPNQKVSVTIASYATNLNGANISWSINDKIQQSGIGLKTFSFTTGPLNTSTKLSITVITTENETVTKTYNIRPASVDLIWESSGYVPPFYKGKSLFAHQDKITFVAIPHIVGNNGQELPAKNLIYKWTQNGSVLDSESGYGKNTLSFAGSVISRTQDISVEVSSTGGEGVAFADIYAEPIEPTVLLYEKNPLYGIQFQKALKNTFEMTDSKEISIFASPYYFGVTNPNSSSLTYTWGINGQDIASDYSSNIRVFRQAEKATSGASLISVSIESATKILQYANTSFNLKFGVKKSNQPTF